MIGSIIAAFIGTIAFSLIYNTPKKYYFLCGFTGAMGWLVYILLQNYTVLPYSISIFLSALVIVFISRLAAVGLNCPATIFLIAGIFPIVPGAGIYWTAYYLVMGEVSQAGETGLQAIKAAIAIVLAIVFVSELPYGFFRLLCGKNRRKIR